MIRRVVVLMTCALSMVACSHSTPHGAVVAATTQNQAGQNPSPAVAKSWPTKWCKVQPGMTRSQVKAIMGEPTSSFPLSSGTPQMSWYAFQYGFTAFLDADDRVRQLDVNTDMMSAADKAAIACGFIRVAR